MRTVFLFFTERHTHQVVRVCITNPPEQLASGDTFYLSIFGNLGHATLEHSYWQADKDLRVIRCKVESRFLINDLVKRGKKVPDCIDDYELPDQEWK
jgi:hypothetical protein